MWLRDLSSLAMWLTLVICIGLFTNSEGANIQGLAKDGKLKIGVMIPWTGGWKLGPKMGAAAGLAVAAINADPNLLSGYTVEWEWKDTQCNPRVGLKAGFDLWNNADDLDAFIGGGCSDVCVSVSFIAAAFDLPFVSFGCTTNDLSRKADFPVFTRTVGTWPSLAPMFTALMKKMKWPRARILATTDIVMQLTANAIKEDFDNGLTDPELKDISMKVISVDTSVITVVNTDGTTAFRTDTELAHKFRETLIESKEQTRGIIFYKVAIIISRKKGGG